MHFSVLREFLPKLQDFLDSENLVVVPVIRHILANISKTPLEIALNIFIFFDRSQIHSNQPCYLDCCRNRHFRRHCKQSTMIGAISEIWENAKGISSACIKFPDFQNL